MRLHVEAVIVPIEVLRLLYKPFERAREAVIGPIQVVRVSVETV